MFAVYAPERPDIIADQYILLDMDLQLTLRNFLHKITTKTHTNIKCTCMLLINENIYKTNSRNTNS